MVFHIPLIFLLMFTDFPFFVAPAVTYGLVTGLGVIELTAIYLVAGLLQTPIFYYWKPNALVRSSIGKNVEEQLTLHGSFLGSIYGNLLTETWSVGAVAGNRKDGLGSVLVGVTISNLLFIATIFVVAIALQMSGIDLLYQYIAGSLIIGVGWTVVSYTERKLG